MEAVQLVIDKKRLQSTNKAAKKLKVNRSELIREALREYLKRMHIRELEERERKAYERIPDSLSEIELWAKEAVWPEE